MKTMLAGGTANRRIAPRKVAWPSLTRAGWMKMSRSIVQIAIQQRRKILRSCVLKWSSHGGSLRFDGGGGVSVWVSEDWSEAIVALNCCVMFLEAIERFADGRRIRGKRLS